MSWERVLPKLEEVWAGVRDVMGQPSALDRKTKEMLYVAVSIANSCTYCAHSHTAAARARGMTEAQYAELISIAGVHLVNEELDAQLLGRRCRICLRDQQLQVQPLD